MKIPSLEQKLAASRPNGYKQNDKFTDAVMAGLPSKVKYFDQVVRTTSTARKESIFMKLKHLPTFVLILLAVGFTLALSVTAYATYLLWLTPTTSTSTPSTNVTGRSELEVAFKECGSRSGTALYELKENAVITEKDIPNVVQAQCELDAIRKWAEDTAPKKYQRMDEEAPMNNPKSYIDYSLNVSIPIKIDRITQSTIVFGVEEKYGITPVKFKLDENVAFISDAKEVTLEDLSNNDPVVYVSYVDVKMEANDGCNNISCSYSGYPYKTKLIAVIKLSLPYEAYDGLAWQSLTERTPCEGNPTETCTTGFSGGIDLLVNDSGVTSSGYKYKEIQGTLENFSEESFSIKATSGAIYNVYTTSNPIGSFNTNRASTYNAFIQIGDSLSVGYEASKNSTSRIIYESQITQLMLDLEIVSKGDTTLKKY